MLQNLHTHTTFCDGRNTPDEIVERALELGFDSIGFSGHAPTVLHDSYEMQNVDGYIDAVNEVRRKHGDKIDILLGVELDYYSAGLVDTSRFDYTIGSVHSALLNGKPVYFDLSLECSKKTVEEMFGGDGTEFARLYYEKISETAKRISPDFIGHFDILTKFSERDPSLIDTESSKYKSYALEALHAVKRDLDLFEVNTGAIGRGHRKTPYPAPFILDEMKSIGAKLVLTSDCHNRDFLNVHFAEAVEYIKAHGFDTLYYLTKDGFVGEKI